MKTGTVIVSFGVHAAAAVFLLSRAETNQRHKDISVAVVDQKPKKAETKPAPPPPPPPKRVARVAPVPEPKIEPVVSAPKEAKAAPVQTAVALSNADLAPGGIAMPGTPKAAAAPVHVASVSPEGPRHKPGHEQEPEACDEEPTKPEPILKTEIEYTAAARADNVEGRLVLKLIIAADGSVDDVEVVSSVEPALDASAVAAAKRWRFKPAMKCGRPVSGGVYKFAQRFELTD